MKTLKVALRFSALFRSKTTVMVNKINPTTLALGSLTTGSALYFATQKIMAEEVLKYEIDDNLLDGEMKEIQVGPKPEDTVLVTKYQG